MFCASALKGSWSAFFPSSLKGPRAMFWLVSFTAKHMHELPGFVHCASQVFCAWTLLRSPAASDDYCYSRPKFLAPYVPPLPAVRSMRVNPATGHHNMRSASFPSRLLLDQTPVLPIASKFPSVQERMPDCKSQTSMFCGVPSLHYARFPWNPFFTEC